MHIYMMQYYITQMGKNIIITSCRWERKPSLRHHYYIAQMGKKTILGRWIDAYIRMHTPIWKYKNFTSIAAYICTHMYIYIYMMQYYITQMGKKIFLGRWTVLSGFRGTRRARKSPFIHTSKYKYTYIHTYIYIYIYI